MSADAPQLLSLSLRALAEGSGKRGAAAVAGKEQPAATHEDLSDGQRYGDVRVVTGMTTAGYSQPCALCTVVA